MRKVYVTSSLENKDRERIVRGMQLLGHDAKTFAKPFGREATGFHWNNIDQGCSCTSADDIPRVLNEPLAIDAFDKDIEMLDWCDTFILALPCNHSANVQLGWAACAGKETVIVLNGYAHRDVSGHKPVLMHRLAHYVFPSMVEMMAHFANEQIHNREG